MDFIHRTSFPCRDWNGNSGSGKKRNEKKLLWIERTEKKGREKVYSGKKSIVCTHNDALERRQRGTSEKRKCDIQT